MRKNMHKKPLKFTQAISGSYAFYWDVADSGYEFLTGDTHKKVDESGMDSTSPWFKLPEAGSHVTRYFPLNKVELHRKFGGLYDESIIEFANRYGLLGKTVFLMHHGGGEVVVGESLERWRYESRAMGVLLAIWDMVQKEDAGKLGQIIIWLGTNDHVLLRLLSEYDESQKRWVVTRHKGKGYVPGLVTEVLASPQINPKLLERWQRGMPIEPAKYYVYHKVNEYLEGHVAPKILPFLKDRIYLFPDSLLAALWVLFLMELTGRVRLRQCDECGNWKEVKVTRDSFYCSNTCRQRAYDKRERAKKERAKQKKEANHERTHSQEV